MTTVSGTSSTTGTSSSSSTSTTSAFNKLGATDFLKLLTAQLNHQDPTQPVDNTQMVAQLAQFSSLAAANQTNTQLSTISDQIGKLGGTTA
jgi:flagellar basal-body rod modification protein FlgD